MSVLKNFKEEAMDGTTLIRVLATVLAVCVAGIIIWRRNKHAAQ
jgi:predicted membrane protein